MFKWDFRRGFAELLVIFLGVTLGLLADDWRQQRERESDAHEALGLILEDLANDSAELASLRPPLARHTTWTAWLQPQWEVESPGPDPDSLGLALRSYLFANSPQLQASAYSSLKDGDRVGLIVDPELRALVIRYYEDSHIRLMQYFEGHQAERLKLMDALYPHVLMPPGRDPGSVWPIVAGPMSVTSSWGRLQQDNLVYNHATTVGIMADLAVRFIDEAQERNLVLRGAIEAALAN